VVAAEELRHFDLLGHEVLADPFEEVILWHLAAWRQGAALGGDGLNLPSQRHFLGRVANATCTTWLSARRASRPSCMCTPMAADGGRAFGLWRTNDPITEWPQLVEKCCGPLA
jgi:hypothetical protein